MPKRYVDILQRFIQLESAGGLILMGATLAALVVANSPLRPGYEALWATPFSVQLGAVGLAKPLILWVNDGLMAVFFFLIGLELKREVVSGHLSSWKKASLPGFAALGGLVVPALIYAVLNRADPVALQGWAIPAATDIAFALGVLSLLGNRVPPAIKAFLLSLAIFDDIGAIAIIAVFYTAKLSIAALAASAVLVVVLWLLGRFRVATLGPYLLVGVILWVAVLKSGVHATLAGVAMAMFIPIDESDESLLHQLERSIHPWVAYGVLPIFAFANAGIPLTGLSVFDLGHRVPLGIILGLFVGKQLGISLATWLTVKVGLASLPEGVRWPQIYGTAILAGIGFTMSLFIASLAFEAAPDRSFLGLERLGILAGSVASGLVGFLVLRSLASEPVT